MNAPSGQQAWGRLRAHLVLVGLMGSGKSTIGRALADVLGRALIDNDDQLRTMTGKSAREVQRDLGVDGLHQLERAVLAMALESDEAAVVTAAASVVEDAPTRVLLHERALVVWLAAPTAVLAARVSSQAHRPLDGDAAAALAAQARARDDLFRSVADVEVSADRAVSLIVDEILRAIRTPRR